MTDGAAILAMPPRTVELRLAAWWQLGMRQPLTFIEHFVFTNRAIADPDPAMSGRSINVVAAAPMHRPLLRELTRLWLTHPSMAILKPRQVWITWWCSALLVWCALSRQYQYLIAQAKRLEDVVGSAEVGDGLLGRAKFILAHIPEARRLGVSPIVHEAEIVFPRQHSLILGIPQGGDVIRQRTASGIVSDEAAFQEEFENAFLAAAGCVRSGGWFLAVSTADLTDGGFFRRLVQDLPDPQ